MDKKETVNAYDEEAVDRAIEGMGMWCALHKGEFLDKAWASFGALCGDEVDLDGCEGIAQAVLNYAFTEWIMFDSMVFGRGFIDEYLDRVEGVSNKNKAILSEIKGTAKYGFSATTVFSMTVPATRGLSSLMSSKGAASRSTAPICTVWLSSAPLNPEPDCRRGLRIWTGAHILSVSSRRTTRHRSMRVRP